MRTGRMWNMIGLEIAVNEGDDQVTGSASGDPPLSNVFLPPEMPLFDGDIVNHLVHSLSAPRDIASPILLGLGIHESAQLHHALEGVDLDRTARSRTVVD